MALYSHTCLVHLQSLVIIVVIICNSISLSVVSGHCCRFQFLQFSFVAFSCIQLYLVISVSCKHDPPRLAQLLTGICYHFTLTSKLNKIYVCTLCSCTDVLVQLRKRLKMIPLPLSPLCRMKEILVEKNGHLTSWG